MLIPSLRKIFECIRTSGLKLSPNKCTFATQKVKFLGKNITPEGIQPESKRIEKFLKTIKLPRTPKQVKRLVGFVQFWRDFIPNLGDKLMPFYKLLRKDIKPVLTEEHEKHLEIVKTDLVKATDLTLRLAKPGMQYVLLCDASYFGTGFVLMIEDYVKNNKNENRKTYAPVAFGSKLFNNAQLKFSVDYNKFLALYFALEHFSHYLWGTEKAVIVLTDNKSLTQFFQAKSIPPSLWNFLDRVLSYNLVIAHIPGRAIYAADFLSRSQTDSAQTMKLKLTDRIPIREIEIESTAKTPDVALSSLANIECLLEQKANVSIEMLDKLKKSGIPDGILKQNEEQSSKTDDDELQTFIRL